MSSKSFFISLIILLLSLLGALALAAREAPLVVETNLENLPMAIDNYRGEEDFFADSVYQELNADKHVYRHYWGADGQSVDLYIGYYGTAKGGRTSHNPYACLPSSGWAILESGQVKMPTSYRPQGVTLNYLVSSKEGESNIMVHWYQTAGNKVVATGLQQNVQRFFGRILENRNDGAYVQVSAHANGRDIAEVRKDVEVFAGEILELLPAYWPVEE